MKKFRIPFLLTIILIVLPLVMTAPGQAAPLRQVPAIISIGWMEGQGSDGERGARLAVRQINEAGGVAAPDGTVYQFQLLYPQRPLVVADDLPIVLRDLISQQVVAIIGPVRNRLVLPNTETLSSAEVPVLTLASADTVTDIDANDNILRLRSAERFYSRAMADVVIQERGVTRIALMQTDVASTEALLLFEQAMQAAGLQPAQKFQRPDNTSLESDTTTIIAENPGAVVMWGSPEDAATLLQSLRSANYNGVFVYRDVLQAVNDGVMSQRLAEGTLGAGSWVYTTPNNVSRVFLVDFVTEYNRIPDDAEAAAYDAVWVLRRFIEQEGPDATELYTSLINSPPIFTVQGQLEPANYANGDVVRHVTVYQLRDTGGPEIVARYANDVRLGDADEVDAQQPIVGLIGTITATPTPSFTPSITPTATDTPLPTETPTPTATPSNVVVIGDRDAVNLRSGPGTDFDVRGQLVEGERLDVIAANADYTWLVVEWRGQQVWVFADVVEIFDPGNLLFQLPIGDASSVQTPGAIVPIDQRPDGPDLVIDSVILNPTTLIPNQSFTATVLVRNQGNQPAGPFTVSTSFQPGGTTVTGNIGALAANSAAGVDLISVVNGGGNFTINIAVDPANTVIEAYETNNTYALSYAVSAPVIAQVEGLTITANAPIVLTGGSADLLWDGFSLLAQGNARLGVIPGLDFISTPSSAIDPGTIALPSISGEQVFGGATFAIVTNEGQRGILRIDAILPGNAVISYRLFSG